MVLTTAAGIGVGAYLGLARRAKSATAVAAARGDDAIAAARGTDNVPGLAVADRGAGTAAHGATVAKGPLTGVRPMSFQVVLAVPAASAVHSCSAWFSFEEVRFA